MIAAAILLLNCHAIDGDTLKCGRERIRLIGIDAPEMPGHCRRNRKCTAGDPVASRRSLARAMAAGPLRMQAVGTDRYGRTLAVVWAGGDNLSCAQLAARQAIYKPDWDSQRRVWRACSI